MTAAIMVQLAEERERRRRAEAIARIYDEALAKIAGDDPERRHWKPERVAQAALAAAEKIRNGKTKVAP